MTDDLVKRLWENGVDPDDADLMIKAADRIEKLEAALREIAYGPHDVDASYAILFGTITTKAIKALENPNE